MNSIKFEDKCIISRTIGSNTYDDPTKEALYEGVCCYIDGGYAQAQNILTRTPIVFLPTIPIYCEPNDSIEIETKFGRKLVGVISHTREIALPITNSHFTRLELKQVR